MVVHQIKKRVIHGLPVAISGVNAEMWRCVRQPACAGAFPLDRVWAKESAHLMLGSVRHPLMLTVMSFCLFVALMILCLLVPAVLFLVLLVPAVPCMFLRGSLLFLVRRSAMLFAVIGMVLPVLVFL